jgi:hypothetical protein
MAESLAPGGLYLLGLHLTPAGPRRCDHETWAARRGGLRVVSRMWTVQVDTRRRTERVGMSYDVATRTRRFRLADEFSLRTYSRQQMASLLSRITDFELLETFDFNYDLDQPIKVDATTEDVIYLLRRR